MPCFKNTCYRPSAFPLPSMTDSADCNHIDACIYHTSVCVCVFKSWNFAILLKARILDSFVFVSLNSWKPQTTAGLGCSWPKCVFLPRRENSLGKCASKKVPVLSLKTSSQWNHSRPNIIFIE